MPIGPLTCDQIAMCLGISTKKVPQAWDPAVYKMARVFASYPAETLQAILDVLEALPPRGEAIGDRDLVLARARRNGMGKHRAPPATA